jgi:hypothetical protein
VELEARQAFRRTKASAKPRRGGFDGKIYVFYQGTREGEMYYNVLKPNGEQEGVKRVPDAYLSCSPSAVAYKGRIHLAWQGANYTGVIWYRTFDGGNNWSPQSPMDGPRCTESPSLVTYNDQLSVYHQGQANDGSLWSVEYVNGGWPGQTKRRVDGVGMSASTAAIAVKDKMYVFHKAWGGGKWMWCSFYDYKDQKWSGDIPFSDMEMSCNPSVVEFNGSLFVFHQSGREQRELYCKKIPM